MNWELLLRRLRRLEKSPQDLVQELKNKTISGADNTLSNVSVASLTSVLAVASATSAQSLSSGAYTKINFNNVETDTHSAITTGANWQWTCPQTGTYEVAASLVLNNGGTAGIQYRLALVKNQAVAADGGFAGWLWESTPTWFVQAVIPSTAVSLVAGDYITAVAMQNNGAAAARSILNDARFCRFMARRIA